MAGFAELCLLVVYTGHWPEKLRKLRARIEAKKIQASPKWNSREIRDKKNSAIIGYLFIFICVCVVSCVVLGLGLGGLWSFGAAK